MEKRKSERLELALPVTISQLGQIPRIKLQTKNISNGGLYIETDLNVPPTTTLSMEIQLTPTRNNQGDKRTFIKLKGRVLRSSDSGMAIQFLEDQHFFRA